MSIIKGDVEKPQWMTDVEDYNDDGCSWCPSSYLCFIPKDGKYEDLAVKIKSLLGSISADGGKND